MKISFFHTPKPRQFEYRPRFYDPQKEELEKLIDQYKTTETENGRHTPEDEITYFQKKVHSFDSTEKNDMFTCKNLFKKKEIPRFNYQPRFSSTIKPIEEKNEKPVYDKKITFQRSKIYNENKLFAEPIPAGKIFTYTIIILLLLLWIFL